MRRTLTATSAGYQVLFRFIFSTSEAYWLLWIIICLIIFDKERYIK